MIKSNYWQFKIALLDLGRLKSVYHSKKVKFASGRSGFKMKFSVSGRIIDHYKFLSLGNSHQLCETQ